MDVAVLGSLNVDVVFQCSDFPKPGETVLCDAVRRGAGGKGLNQAVAAARAGAATAMIGALGRDPDGDFLLHLLEQEAIDVSAISRLDDRDTGLAHIIVDEVGENSIVVASGANHSPLLEQYAAMDIKSSVRLAQLEVPVAAVGEFFKHADPGSLRILNAAPAREEARALFPQSDILIFNEHELAFFAGLDSPAIGSAKTAVAARSLLSRSDQVVLVTRGAQGTELITSGRALAIATREVRPVDTTGAGDCFCGVLAERLSKSVPLADAIHMANMAASIAVTRPGAAQAMPSADEIGAIAERRA